MSLPTTTTRFDPTNSWRRVSGSQIAEELTIKNKIAALTTTSAVQRRCYLCSCSIDLYERYLVRYTNSKTAIRRFLAPLRGAFTTRPDGSTWSRAANTWNVAPAYVEGLIRPGSHKTFRGIGKRLAVNEHRVRRFISESPWGYEAVQNHLNQQIPETIASPAAC